MSKKTRKYPSSDESPAKNVEPSLITVKGRFFYKPIVHVSLIVLFGLIVYSNTFDVPFEFDDITTIINNSSIRDPHNYLPPRANRDIGYLTFSMNYRLSGLDVFGYHAVNLLIHMLNAVFVYFLVSLTFRTPFLIPWMQSISKQNISYLFAFFAGGLFALHPLQTESVTYIVQRFTSLATFFCLLSFVTYIKARLATNNNQGEAPPTVGRTEPPRPYRLSFITCIKARYTFLLFYCSSIMFAVLAMKTKEIAFTLPLCLTVYEFMFFKGKPIKRALYLIPLLLTMLIIPLILLSLSGPVGDIIGEVSEVTRDSYTDIPRWSYLFTQFRVIVTYIRLLFFPINQNLDYDYPVYHSLIAPEVFFSFMFVLLVFALGVYLYRISRYPETNDRYWFRLTSFGIFWFFITLSVESSVIALRDVIFEHRVYLPSVGFFMALTGAIGAVLERWGSRVTYANKAVVYVMIPVMLVLSGATYARNALWKDSIRLWGNAAEGSPNKARPHYNLGVAYFDLGRITESINEYQIALKLDPAEPEAHNNLGKAYSDQGRLDEAINEYKTALTLNPYDAIAHNNLGAAYVTQGQIDEAIREYQITLKLQPDYAQARQMLDFLLKK